MSDSMREARGARRETGGGRFDDAIDRAVREMLDVEPPDGLRGRVLARIDPNSVASAFGRKDHVRRKIWIVAPLAAAAVIILAVLLPSKTPRTVVNPVTTVATTQPVTQPQSATIARAATPPARTQQARRAAVAANDASEDVVWIDPLAAPPAITVAAIEPARPAAVPSIDLAPAEIPALVVRPISDTPRERRNQE